MRKSERILEEEQLLHRNHTFFASIETAFNFLLDSDLISNYRECSKFGTSAQLKIFKECEKKKII